MISAKQTEMLGFIENFVTQNGYPPTYEEIRTGLDISTKSLVNYHLEALENASYLTRVPNTPRGIRLHAWPAEITQPAPRPTDETLAELDPAQVIELTYGMVTNNRNLYALKVRGDTVCDSDTSEGDIIILQQTQVQNGDLAAVRLPDDPQITLKRYHRENGHVRLLSPDETLAPLIVDPARLEIRGKVLAVIRQQDS